MKRLTRKHIYNQLKQTSNNHKITKLERNSRDSKRATCKNRKGSIPTREEKIRCENKKDRIRGINEPGIGEHWIHPFIGLKRKEPLVNIKINEKEVTATVDTGATRVMMTSLMATRLWGNRIQNQLQRFPNRAVEDAQGNPVKVLGYKICTVSLGNHLETSYPVVIYEANHEEMLIGYTFLVDNKLNIYCGHGIGNQPKSEVIKRLNFVEEPLECTTIQDATIPPKSMSTIKVKIWFPSNWNEKDRIAAIGCPIVTHSEDLEYVGITQLKCPYTYDLLSIDMTANVVINNSENMNPLYINKNEIIAHAEFVHDEVPADQIKRIIKDSSMNKIPFDEETQAGEYKLQSEEKPGRFDYVEKINIKSEEHGTEQFCKTLLRETEPFWSKSTFDLGRFDRKAKMTLKDPTPIYDRYRPINPRKEAMANEIIQQLERHNIISRANSPFCSQPVWVYKKAKDKTGKQAVAGELDLTAPRALRLALDYRKINKKIYSECHFPNPSIKEILFKLKKAKYVSVLDLTNSYWNIELTEETKPILAFQTSSAQFVWERLPQGTSPSQSIMAECVADTIINGGIADCTLCYVDNIICMSESLQQHKKDLKRTIEAFQQRGWKANPEKSHLFINTECRLFGFNVNLAESSIGPDPQKVEAILKLPPPVNQKTARSLCGTIIYYSDLIPDLGPLMAPLHEITKEGKFEWTTECQQNFEAIKKKLSSLPIVYMADFNKPMHLFTDAAMSQFLGYHISQYNEKLGKYTPIAWGSHKFNKNEQAMSQPEAELFAIVFAITQESLLLGFSKIIVHTDCKSLTYLFRFAKICSKLTRWQLILSSFDLEIYFESSDSIGIIISDMLSRRPGKRITNRRPKIEEIDQLPKIDLSHKPHITFQEAKEEITKQLNNMPPLSPETIKHIQMKFTPATIKPEELHCNKDIIRKIAQGPLETFDQQAYKNQYVYTPEHLAYRNDISPSGRLINYVLQEAPGLSLTTLKHHQLADPFFGPKMKQMITENKALEDFAIKNGILLKETKDPITNIAYQICVPKSLSQELIGKFHTSVFGAHADLKKLMTNLKKRFFIKNLKNECMDIIKKCQICILNKSFNIKKQPFGTKLKVTGPRQVYSMDICTVDTQVKDIDENLPTSFLIITDVWCLYTLAIPIQANATSREILEKFSRHIIQPFGLPKIGIVTDGAKNFSNNLSNTFSAVLGLQQFRISQYNARANPSERVNRAILSGLRYASQQFHLEPEVFKNLLNYIVLSWNTSVLSHLNFSPYQLFLSSNYEPAALTSFVTIQEADKDYGDFISGLVKTQHIVENLVNSRLKEARDKRYNKQNEKSKYSIYKPGMLVMIKENEDHTKRAHKLRPRFKGPFKIVQEYQNNVEVIDWSPTRKAQFIHKYKNEARNIPKYHRQLISKDRIKPCDQMAFYYDENLARRFYQEFWDAIRDVEPIQEIERHITPTAYVDHQPPHRPSSLILPLQIGIKKIPVPQDFVQQPVKKTRKKHKTPSSTTDSSGSSHKINKPQGTPQLNQSRTGPVREETTSEENSSENTSDSTSDSDQDDDDAHNNQNDDPINQQDDQPRYQDDQEPQDQNAEVEQRQPHTPQQKQSRTNIPRPIYQGYRPYSPAAPFGRGTVSPLRHGKQPRREHWSTVRASTVIGIRGSDSVLIVPQGPPQHILQDEPQPGPSGLQLHQGAASQPPPQPPKSTKSTKTAKTNKSNKTRMDPAVLEALTSDSSFFKDQEFDKLSQYYQEGRHLSQEIQDVSDRLEQDYQNIEEEIDNILSDKED